MRVNNQNQNIFELILDLLKTPYGLSLIAFIIGFIIARCIPITIEVIDNKVKITYSDQNTISGLNYHLDTLTPNEKERLREKGFYEIEPLLRTVNEIYENGRPRERIRNLEDFNTKLRKYKHFHIADENLIEGIRKLRFEDKVVINLLRLVSRRRPPFDYELFKIGFSRDIPSYTAKLCEDNSALAHPLEIRKSFAQDQFIGLNASASKDCKLGDKKDPCLDSNISGGFNNYTALTNPETGKIIANNRYIQISWQDAKEIYPDKFDEDGYPTDKLNACEYGHIRRSSGNL